MLKNSMRGGKKQKRTELVNPISAVVFVAQKGKGKHGKEPKKIP